MRLAEHLLHGEVMRDDAAQHGNVPDVVARAEVVEFAGEPALGDPRGVDDGADEVDGHGGQRRRVKRRRVLQALASDELCEGKERGQGEGDVEGDTDPGEVVAVEGGVPGEVDAADGEDGGEAHVGPAGGGFAVEGGVFKGHDGGADEERDARVVDAGVALEQGLVRDAVHGVHDARAQQALAGGEEEDGGDDNVRRRAGVEVDVLRVEVEGEAEHHHEADEVGPDVCGLVVDAADGADAGPVAVVEAVASEDVLVGLPGLGQIFVANQAVLLCSGERAVYREVDLELDGLTGLVRLVETGIDNTTGADELLVDCF